MAAFLFFFPISGNLHRERLQKNKKKYKPRHIKFSFPAAIFRSDFCNIGPSGKVSGDVQMRRGNMEALSFKESEATATHSSHLVPGFLLAAALWWYSPAKKHWIFHPVTRGDVYDQHVRICTNRMSYQRDLLQSGGMFPCLYWFWRRKVSSGGQPSPGPVVRQINNK